MTSIRRRAVRWTALLVGVLLAPVSLSAQDEALERALADRDAMAIARRVREIGRDDPRLAIQTVPVAFARVEGVDAEEYAPGDRYHVFRACVQALAAIEDPVLLKSLLKAFQKHKSWAVRYIILRAALQNPGMDDLEYCRLGLKDEAADVVALAARMAGRSREIELVRPTLRSLKAWEKKLDRDRIARGRSALEEQSAGRAWVACRDALHRLTGISFMAAVDYDNYIRAHMAEIDPKAVDLEEGDTQERAGTTGVGLFGLEITGRNIVFVLDVSGSMETTDPLTPEQREKLRGGTGVGRTREEELMKERKRIVRAKRELDGVIGSLPEDRRFNLVVYSTNVATWQERSVPASGPMKDKARAYVDALQAKGVTFTDFALEAALSDPMVDTIYLITDGAPTHRGSRGDELPEDAPQLMARILEDTRAVNYLRGVRIFTLGFKGAEEEFLKRLAREHEGRYLRIE